MNKRKKRIEPTKLRIQCHGTQMEVQENMGKLQVDDYGVSERQEFAFNYSDFAGGIGTANLASIK
jgi:hypothetical protein